MREVELKAVVSDIAAARKSLEDAGGTLELEGRMEDRRYDTEGGTLASRDEVLRIRRYPGSLGARGMLEWKGPVNKSGPYKIREEISTAVSDPDAAALTLEKLGYVVVLGIDREITQYRLGGATIRFEAYPRMDLLVEVEGDPDAIESAIAALGMARGEFTAEGLGAFVERFERRTGVASAVSDREMR